MKDLKEDLKEMEATEQSKVYSRRNFLLSGLTLTLIGGAYSLSGCKDCSCSHVQEKVKETEKDIYQTLVDKVSDSLSKNPEHANRLLRKSILSISGSEHVDYEPETLVEMFKVIRDKAEQKPEITNYLGPKAKKHVKGL